MKGSQSKQKGVMLGFKMKQKANLVPEELYSSFYAMYNYFIFSNIDYLLITKLSFIVTRCNSMHHSSVVL